MTTLTDRYVHATLRAVPESRRADIGAELRTSIEDMIDARAAAGEPVTEAERAVLTELGEPERLASEYAGRSLQLIGPRYFLVWKKVTISLLTYVPLIVTLVVGVVKVLDGSELGDGIGAVISAAFTTTFQIVFWTTLVFAIMDRVNIEDDGLEGWTVDKLPDVPGEGRATVTDAIASSAFIIVMIVAIVGQQFRSWVQGPDGDDVPVLDPSLWSGWLPLLLGALVLSLVAEAWKYRVGRWTWPIASLTIVASAAFAVPVAWLASREQLLGQEFIEAVDVGNMEAFIAGGALVVMAWEICEAVYRTWQDRRPDRGESTTAFTTTDRVR